MNQFNMNYYNIEIVVAHSDNLVIGYQNDLPWPHNKEDMKHFKSLTLGQKVVMGRVTYNSILKKNKAPLKDRTSVVMTRNGPEDIFEQILQHSKRDKIMVIGGEQIYKLFFPYANTLHITRIIGDYVGDTFFPEYRDGEFECIAESGKPGLRFLTYKRTQNLKLI